MKVNLTFSGIDKAMLEQNAPAVSLAHEQLHARSGAGSDYVGWLDFVSRMDGQEIDRILRTAERMRGMCDVFVVAGIGGSYLGAKAVIEALAPAYRRRPEVLFTGNSLSALDLDELLHYLEDKEVCLNVISKSGTTLETAMAFRMLRRFMEQKYGDEAAERIIATTDATGGALRSLVNQKGYESYVVPEDVGGRYSVITAVGLLPIAVAGIDVKAFLEGVREAEQEYSEPRLEKNAAYQYAAARNVLYAQEKYVEIYVQYKPRMMYFNEWLKQLYGESEGKEHKGIFPASVVNTTDLHSMGQYVQDGRRMLFETVVDFRSPSADIFIPQDEENLDGLNYLAGHDLHFINRKAMMATMIAHVEGGVPNILIETEKYNAFTLGKLMYFFMKACGISGYMLGVNPFNQPGVEDYKRNMFALLGKPGTEAQREELENKLREKNVL